MPQAERYFSESLQQDCFALCGTDLHKKRNNKPVSHTDNAINWRPNRRLIQSLHSLYDERYSNGHFPE